MSSFIASFKATDSVAKITLSGELDANTAPIFKAEIEKATEIDLKKLVLIMNDLEYMSSAGLRVLIFAKQKMGSEVDIYLIGMQENVKDTIEKTGFHRSVIVADEYPN